MSICVICQGEPAIASLAKGVSDGVCSGCIERIAEKLPSMAHLFSDGPRLPPTEEGGAALSSVPGFALPADDSSFARDSSTYEAMRFFSGLPKMLPVEEVFSEFREGVARVVRPEDVDVHLDLSVVYREMGLLDDALGECAMGLRHARGALLVRALDVIFGRGSGFGGDLGALRDVLYPA